MVNPDTGRVHTNYAQAVAVTGRLSSNDPNLQNIPIRTAEGRRMREAFIAPPGHVIVSADYSQIELRIMAHISGDAGLLRAFSEGEDMHRATAGEVFARGAGRGERRAAPLRQGDQLRPDLRHERVRPGAEPRHRAQRGEGYIDRYFERFSGVKRYMDETKARARRTGLRRDGVRPPPLAARDPRRNGPRRAGAERQAINAPMQGTAADLIKLAMIAVQAGSTSERKRTAW